MQSLNVLLAEQDSTVADVLAHSLDEHRHSVRVVHSLRELRAEISQSRIHVVVADLETIGLADVASLRQEYHVPVICTHRVPDDELWTAAMEAGASDICEKSNIIALVRALRYARASFPIAA